MITITVSSPAASLTIQTPTTYNTRTEQHSSYQWQRCGGGIDVPLLFGREAWEVLVLDWSQMIVSDQEAVLDFLDGGCFWAARLVTVNICSGLAVYNPARIINQDWTVRDIPAAATLEILI
jgi:hypothetical protein